MRNTCCPWCGNRARVRQSGTLARHKGSVRVLTGRARLDCDGAGRNPDTLTAEQRAELKTKWPYRGQFR